MFVKNLITELGFVGVSCVRSALTLSLWYVISLSYSYTDCCKGDLVLAVKYGGVQSRAKMGGQLRGYPYSSIIER